MLRFGRCVGVWGFARRCGTGALLGPGGVHGRGGPAPRRVPRRVGFGAEPRERGGAGLGSEALDADEFIGLEEPLTR